MELPVMRKTAVYSDERGAVAVLVALCLLVLIGFAAIAVDSGIAYGDRRQQQSAADVGALAALQFAKTSLAATHPDCTGLTGKSLAACRGAEEAVAVVNGTLPGRYDDADWDACVDSNKPAEYTIASAISDCISFTDSLRRARVALPGTDVDTSFGAVIGVDTIRVSAWAEAGLEMTLSGGVLPFALGPSGANSNQACFFSQDTPTLNIEPCDGPSQGNFGKLDIRWYGNELYGMGGPYCAGQNQWRMAANIIAGTDHPMEEESANPGIVNDVSNCNNIANPVDEIETWTGNSAGAIADGLYEGLGSFEGRLACKDGDMPDEDYPAHSYTSTDCVTVNNQHPEDLDHTPLWEYIDFPVGPGTGSGQPCNPGQTTDRASMENCLDWYKTTGQTDPLFTADLVTSPRFGGVPELHADPGNGTGAYRITGFTPIYLETLYLQCNAMTCDVAHSPGEASSGSCPSPITGADSSCGWTTNGNKNVEAITAFILTLDMLPGDVAENFPFQPGTIVYNLYR